MVKTEQPREIIIIRRVLNLFGEDAQKLSNAVYEKTGLSLEPRKISALANRSNTQLTEDHKALANALLELPHIKQVIGEALRPKAKRHKLLLTDKHIDALKAELTRTQLSPRVISLSIPEAQCAACDIYRWVNGKVKSANRNSWNAVMTFLLSRPTRVHRTAKSNAHINQSERIAFSDEMHKELKSQMKRAGLTPTGIETQLPSIRFSANEIQ